MLKRDTPYWRNTTDENWQFHSYDWEPAIVENSRTEIEKVKTIDWQEVEMEVEVEWYKARFNHWVPVRSERDLGWVFEYDEQWNLIPNE